MAQVPTNEKLWMMVVFQAKTKYHPYPSPGASNWVHKRYIELGGKFEDGTSATARKEAVTKAWAARIKAHKENKEEKK